MWITTQSICNSIGNIQHESEKLCRNDFMFCNLIRKIRLCIKMKHALTQLELSYAIEWKINTSNRLYLFCKSSLGGRYFPLKLFIISLFLLIFDLTTHNPSIHLMYSTYITHIAMCQDLMGLVICIF